MSLTVSKSSCNKGLCIKTVEMHTGGQALRLVVSGLPVISGSTALEKEQYFRTNLDHIRKLIILEPRGHFDMFSIILVETDVPDATVGCLFLHNEGYGSMCGDAVISLGRYLVDHGFATNITSPETRLVIECPCGSVESFVEYVDGKAGDVRYNSVPSYIFKKDVKVLVYEYGEIIVDIVYGGAFYVFIPAVRLGISLGKTSVDTLRAAAKKIKGVLMQEVQLSHPKNSKLAFLYGVIFTDDTDDFVLNKCVSPNKHTCEFADQEVDRSPCGSGTTARVAQQFFRGGLQLGEQRVFQGPSGATFKAKAVKEVIFGDHPAVIVEVSGRGYYTGSSTFTLEDDDEIGKGFLLS